MQYCIWDLYIRTVWSRSSTNEPVMTHAWSFDAHDTVQNWHHLHLCYEYQQIALNTARLINACAPCCCVASWTFWISQWQWCINSTDRKRWPVVSSLLGQGAQIDEPPPTVILPPWAQCGTVGWGRRNLQHRSPFAVASGFMWACKSVRAVRYGHESVHCVR
jgi:hypothetical protein